MKTNQIYKIALFLLIGILFIPSSHAAVIEGVNVLEETFSFTLAGDSDAPGITTYFPLHLSTIGDDDMDVDNKVNMTATLNETGNCKLTMDSTDTYLTAPTTMDTDDNLDFYYYLDEALHTGWYNYYLRCQDTAGNPVNQSQNFFVDITEGSTGSGGSGASGGGAGGAGPVLEIVITPENYHVFDTGTREFSMYVTSDYDAQCRYSLEDTGFTEKASIWDNMDIFSYTGTHDHQLELDHVAYQTDIFVLCWSYDGKWSNYEHMTYYVNGAPDKASVWDWWVSQVGGVFYPTNAEEFTIAFTLLLAIMTFGAYDLVEKDKKVKKRRREEIDDGF